MLSLSFEKDSIKKLIELRNVQDKNPLLVERSWNYFFYQLNSNKPINIKCDFSNNLNFNFKITKEKVEKISDLSMYDDLNNQKKLLKAKKEFTRFFSQNSHTYSLNLYLDNNEPKLVGSYVYTDKGEIIQKNSDINLPVEMIAYLPSNRNLNHEELLVILNEALALGKYSEIISILQKIDNTISDIREVDNKIMLAREDMIFLPLGLFGDAIQVLLDIVLALILIPEGSILMIDEIENGVHHTKHKIIITTIIDIIKDKNIQIFTTSHSAEFINTFNDYITENYINKEERELSYFELIKTRTGQIISNEIDSESLNYKIDNQKSFRGEP